MVAKHLKKICFLAVIFFVLGACSNSGSDNNSQYLEAIDNPDPVYSSDNTSEVLVTGNPIGSNNVPLSNLRKQVSLTINNPDARLEFDDAYVARGGLSTDYFNWMVFVRNVTLDETLCFIRINNIVLNNSLGQELASDTFTYIYGSVRKFIVSTIESNTCLLPGERGVFIGIDSVVGLYENVTELEINEVAVNDTSETIDSLAHVIHGGVYQTEYVAAQIQNLLLPVRNIGTATADMGLALFVVVDSGGLPLDWSYFSIPSGRDGVVAINGQRVLETIVYIYDGRATGMYVFLDYQELTGSTLNSLSLPSYLLFEPDKPQFKKQYIEQRNQWINYKETLAVQ